MSRHFDSLFSSLVLHGLKINRISISRNGRHIKPNVGIEGFNITYSLHLLSRDLESFLLLDCIGVLHLKALHIMNLSKLNSSCCGRRFW